MQYISVLKYICRFTLSNIRFYFTYLSPENMESVKDRRERKAGFINGESFLCTLNGTLFFATFTLYIK